MTKDTFPAIPDDVRLDVEPIWFKSSCRTIHHKGPKFPPDTDIDGWLKNNSPLSFNQLVDIRYSLYHRCSRGPFVVSGRRGDEFTLSGRHGDLRVVSNRARRYLLWKLRLIGREKGWINALPRTKKRELSDTLRN